MALQLCRAAATVLFLFWTQLPPRSATVPRAPGSWQGEPPHVTAGDVALKQAEVKGDPLVLSPVEDRPLQ